MSRTTTTTPIQMLTAAEHIAEAEAVTAFATKGATRFLFGSEEVERQLDEAQHHRELAERAE